MINFSKILLLFFIFCFNKLKAQPDSIVKSDSIIKIEAGVNSSLYTPYTTDAKRIALYTRLVQNSINKNILQPLNDDTEESWEDGLSTMEVLLYKSPFTESRVFNAFDSITERSIPFQRSLLEAVYTLYPNEFNNQVIKLIELTTDLKIFTMCAEYLIQSGQLNKFKNHITDLIKNKFDTVQNNALLISLQSRIDEKVTWENQKILKQLFSNDFLKGNIVLYSVQRKDRDYPGMVIIRKVDGSFIKAEDGNLFSVPQLARSITNLPPYLTDGNTPQGIFRMHGFDVSMSQFIGPSPNIQLTMPVEASLQHFFNDSTITDSVWTINWYKKLLPERLKNYFPLFQAFYAGMAGRTEIIAHGTTIDPEYYKGKSYYPHTPSLGCLCTKEIWNGKRLESNQQKLVDALLKAGGAEGYCVVIEIDDKDKPVTIEDISAFLPPATAN